MSERVFALLVRLYPAAFRRKYQQEALQLYRDRLRDECGPFRRLRLYCDLVMDAAMGASLAWRNSYAEMSPASTAGNVSGLPSFHVLNREPLRPGAIVAGCVFSVTALAAFVLLMRLPVPHRFPNASGALSPVEAVLERLNRIVSAPAGNGGDGDASEVNGGSSPVQAIASSASHRDGSVESPLSAKERDEVVQGVAENLTAHYFDQLKAQAAVERLRALEKQGAYAGIVDGRMLAERLTADVVSTTGDSHLNVAYSRNAIPHTEPGPPSATAIEQYRTLLIQENCSLEKEEILPGNVGYLKLNSFPDLDVCGAMLHKAIAKVDGANAVIFDLRDNTGGLPETVAEVASMLFDRRVPWYNPRANPSSTILFPAAGSRLANKPVYVLTSSRTISGAEHFTYNLKMLKRATVIGETTAGASHAGAFHRVDDHFGMGIPKTKITNPYGKPDWAGVGIEPDVKVKAADALDTAEKLAAEMVERQ